MGFVSHDLGVVILPLGDVDLSKRGVLGVQSLVHCGNGLVLFFQEVTEDELNTAEVNALGRSLVKFLAGGIEPAFEVFAEVGDPCAMVRSRNLGRQLDLGKRFVLCAVDLVETGNVVIFRLEESLIVGVLSSIHTHPEEVQDLADEELPVLLFLLGSIGREAAGQLKVLV